MGKQSKRLTEAQQQVVAEYAVNHPSLTDAQVGLRFGCTSAQARHARQKAERGDLSVRRDIISDRLSAEAVMQQRDMATLLDRQVHYTLSQLESNPDMKPGDRVTMLGTISRTMRTAQEMRLVARLGTRDAGVILGIIRRFVPEASEDDAIQIYMEEVERWKATQS